MIEEVQPVLPVGVADRYVELFLVVPLLGLGILFFLFWLLKGLHIYARTGCDFRLDFGPQVTDEVTGKPLGPIGTLVTYFLAVVFFGGFLFLVLCDKM